MRKKDAELLLEVLMWILECIAVAIFAKVGERISEWFFSRWGEREKPSADDGDADVPDHTSAQ